jgi:hypothetical protein
MHIDKAEVVAQLRTRGMQDRADWVERELPDVIDTLKNGSLMHLLNIDPSTLSTVEPAAREG